MPLPPLATTAQLAAWMQVEETDLPAGASLVLDVASTIVRRQARQSFTLLSSTVVLYPTDCYVVPPSRPVRSIETAEDPDTGEAIAYRVRWDRLYLAKPCEAVRLTYTHGYDEVPGDVLGVLLTAAGRVLSNPRDLRQETVGSESLTYSAETIGASLSPADKDLLAGYRRNAAMVSAR